MSLTGKVALVTGGSKGIGRSISIHLASLGAKVIVNYSSDASSASETVQEIGSSNAFAIKADVGNVSEITTLVEESVEHFGRLDILVACAGIMPLNELENLTESEFDRVFNVNAKGPLFLSQVNLLPHSIPQWRSIRIWIESTLIHNPESSTTYDIRGTHNSLLNNPMHCHDRNTKLPRVRSLQRRNRANDPRAIQRSLSKRHHGQRRRSGSYSYGSLHERQA